MTKAEKADFVVKTLEEIYPTVPIPLDHTNDFELLIAVLLSAQCTDKRVNMITPALFAKADNAYDMQQLALEEVEGLIKTCGLYKSKAKNIKKLADSLVEQHKGIVPSNFKDLEALAGVGHKTASVVMSQAFGHPAFPVDTHIHRLMWRWGLTNGKSVEQTEKDAKKLFAEELWNKLHLQIIYYGREYSPARGLDIEKDIITKKIGRKSFLNSL
ncbi:endonuclease III [bacterium SCSIO 12643]|nr:endonuclease III [bacterium SCSIO 12643]